MAESLQVLSEDVKIVSTTQASTNAIVDSAVKSNQEFRQTIIEAVEENEGQFIAAVQEFKAMKDQLTQINSLVNEHEKRFSILFPIIREFKRGPNAAQSNTSLELNALQTRIESLQQKVYKLEQEAWSQFASPTNSDNYPQLTIPTPVVQVPSNVEASIMDLKHQVKVLQHRIVGGGVQIGNKVFQSIEDVQIWVKAELPSRRYGLFVDAVSILDFFSFLGHIDAESQVSTLHNANKAGFTSL